MCAVVFANFTNYSQTQITAKITYMKKTPFRSKVNKKKLMPKLVERWYFLSYKKWNFSIDLLLDIRPFLSKDLEHV